MPVPGRVWAHDQGPEHLHARPRRGHPQRHGRKRTSGIVSAPRQRRVLATRVWYLEHPQAVGVAITKPGEPPVMETRSFSERHEPTRRDILHRGLVWAFTGALYAAMFVPVFEVTGNSLALWIAPIFATVAATAGGALVYSSSQLAVQIAIFSNIAVFGYLIMNGVVIPPLGPTLVGAGVGAVAGAVYGLVVKESRIYRAGAKLLAGLVAGAAVSVLALAWVLVSADSLVWLIALLAPVSGMVYLKLAGSFIQRFAKLSPPFADGAIAGLVIGGFIGFGLWLAAGVALQDVVPEWQDAFDRITDRVPGAIAAASATTFFLGTIKAAFKLNWGDPYDH